MDSNGQGEPRYDYLWKLRPSHTPLVSRYCSKCEKSRVFYCSDKFRINAQKKNVDVWLIYKCTVCDTTWNCSIMRQVSPRSIPPDLYYKFQNNDQQTSWDYAFKYDLLKRNEAVPETKIEYTVEGEKIDLDAVAKEKVVVLVTMDYLLHPRLDALLADQLNVSRKQLDALFESGSIEIDSKSITSLSKKLKEKQAVITLHVEATRKALAG